MNKKKKTMGKWKTNALTGSAMLMLAVFIWLNPHKLSTLREANMVFYNVLVYLYLAVMALNIGCAIWVYLKERSEWVVVRFDVESTSDRKE